MKKNILIIAYSYPPDIAPGAQRPYALAKLLDKSKYNVKVITCQNSDFQRKKDKTDSEDDAIKLISIKSRIGSSAANLRQGTVKKNSKTTTLSKIKSVLFKIGQQLIFPDKAMFWYPNVIAYLKQNQDIIANASVVFSTSPGATNHRIARFIKRKNKNVRWIADFRDFNYVENWEGKQGIKAILHKKLETTIINEATYLTFVTQTMYKAYQKFYPRYKDKMYCVYNGFDKGLPVPSKTVNNKLSFFYAGSFYNGLRSPFHLMQLLDRAIQENLLKKEDVEIKIAGNIEDEIIAAMHSYQSFDCVKFLGSIPRAEVLKHMEESTFLWLIVANIKSHYQTIPIKLFEYIAARRPMVNFAPIVSESSQIVQENNLGYNFDTSNFDVEENYSIFKSLVLKYHKGDFNEPLPNNKLDAFTWEKQIDKIVSILEEG